LSDQASSIYVKPQPKGNLHLAISWISHAIKRVFDIAISVIGLVLLSPFFLLIAMLIKRDSPGPVFYHGPRSGKGETTFSILKFRTMFERPESYAGARVTAQDDDRITPVGRWLRDTKLNEIPQLWNVLIGAMSLVGPRPEDPEITATWSEDVRREVLSVRPGITSPASVLYRDEESLLTSEQVMNTYFDSILPTKLRLDQLYVRHRSFWLDLDILFWTALVLLPRLGSYSPPERLLFLGPVSSFIRRYLSWFIIDTLVTLFAIGISGLFWRSFGPLDIGWPRATVIALGFALIFSIAGAVFGINRISWSNTGALDALDLLPAVAVATVITSLVNWFWPQKPLLPPPLVLLASAVAFIGFVVVRYRSRLFGGLVRRWLAVRGGAMEARERVLIIGGGEAGQFMSWLLNSSRGATAFRAVGIVDDDLYKQGTRIQGLPVLGGRSDVPKLVEQLDIGIIIFAIHNIPAQERRELLEICTQTSARLLMMPDILGLLASLTNVKDQPQRTAGQDHEFENQSLYNYYLSSVSPYQLNSWLDELEESSRAGDIETIRKKIQTLREQIHYDLS
jgi:lipopolysaccharide/colanic/teichoic acid biosynthesis glycosyltransferase